MKFMFKEMAEDEYVLLVPPANRPLIDGRTGDVMIFTAMEIHVARYSRTLTNEVGDIIQSINALETNDYSQFNRHHKEKRRWV